MAAPARSADDIKSIVKKAMGNMRLKFRETKPAQDHMVQLMLRFPYLQAEAEEHNTHTAEGHLSCVRLHGVVAMQYKQSSYNIPMAIFVSSGYISRPPIFFVLETSAVAIKPSHPHVGPNGMVYLPYLHSWNDSSNLVSCLDALLAVFQQKPFVYARPPPGSVPPPTAAMMQSVGGQMHMMQTQASLAAYPPVPAPAPAPAPHAYPASGVAGYAAANHSLPYQQQQQQQRQPQNGYIGASHGYPPLPSGIAGYGPPQYAPAVQPGGMQQTFTSQAPPNPYTQPPPPPARATPPTPSQIVAPPPPPGPPPPPPAYQMPAASAAKPPAAPAAAAESSDEPPDEFVDNFFMCEVMTDPVFADDGYTYERAYIVEWLQKHDTSPATGGKLESKRVVPNHALRGRIIAWKEARGLPTH